MKTPAEYLARAYHVASASSDRSNQNGALLVGRDGRLIGEGCNDFCEGVVFTEARATTRPTKYRYYEHAERRAVFAAARKGKIVDGATMFCPWAACCPCARALIDSGVRFLVLHEQRMKMTPERWLDDVNQALEMLEEGGIEISYFSGPVKGPSVIVNGELWSPTSEEIQGLGNYALAADTEMS